MSTKLRLITIPRLVFFLIKNKTNFDNRISIDFNSAVLLFLITIEIFLTCLFVRVVVDDVVDF